MKELIRLLATAEQRKKALQVVNQVRANIRIKNYFGWRSFIDDVSIDLVSYMIQTDFEYSAGAYVTCGMQSAIDHCRYCNALKRRGDYEYISLDDEDSYLQIVDPDSEPSKKLELKERCDSLYISIKQKFGNELANTLKPLIYGEDDKVSRKLLVKCKNEEFKQFLREFRM